MSGSPASVRYRVPIRTIARRVWAGEWRWCELWVEKRRRLGLVTTGQRTWLFAQDRQGCWLKRI